MMKTKAGFPAKSKAGRSQKGRGSSPAENDEICSLRARIDKIDTSLLKLLNERARVAMAIGKAKADRNLDFHSPARERQIYERLCAINPGPFPNEAIRSVFREILSASLSLEKPLKISFPGPWGTFTHLACLEHFGQAGLLVPERTLRDVLEAVERQRVNYGIIPIENSTEGLIAHALDLFFDFDVRISAEIFLEITLDLLSSSSTLQDVRRVYSHPQALAQCRSWLQNHLPGAELVEVESTAKAAEIASSEAHSAAVASPLAAKLHELTVLERSIQDGPFQYTRFLVLGTRDADRTGRDKTSLVFYTRDRVGALHAALRPFVDHKVNVTRIESRPHRKRPWESVFFLDIRGHRTDPNVRKAMAALSAVCSEVKLLGSYPEGRGPSGER